MRRFCVLSDVHLHNGWKHTSLKLQTDNLSDLIGYCVSNGIDHILFCGDMFHTHGNIKTEVLYALNTFLCSLNDFGIKLIGIPGNHDFADKNGFITGLGGMTFVGQLVDKSPYVLDDIPIYGVPYCTDEDQLKGYLSYNYPKDCLLLAHQGVSGVEVNSKGFVLNEILRPDMITDNILHCFTGHYHTHKAISSNLTIPGALGQYVWSDANEHRGFLDVMIDSETNVHIRRIDSLHWKQFEVIDYSEVESYKVENAARNIKIRNVPSKKTAEELIHYNMNLNSDIRNIECEIITPVATSAETIRSDTFSTADFFEEYSIARNLSKEYVDFGRKLIAR